jgi:hypothetical protein
LDANGATNRAAAGFMGIDRQERPMQLKGSCHCGKVHFEVTSEQPVPYQRCYCTICRKTQGGGGYAINLGADAASLKVRGREHIKIYHARIKNPEDARAHTSEAERTFCGECGSGLWLFSAKWPELIHPFASAIDSELPVPPEHTHLMLEFRAGWAEVERAPNDKLFERYPDESLAEWHARH